MKNLISILFVMMIVGCGKSLTEEEKKVVGSYEGKFHELPFRLFLLENGKTDWHGFGEKFAESTWKIVEKEVLVVGKEFTEVLKIEPNGDLTVIAVIKNGNRAELSNIQETTYKKLN